MTPIINLYEAKTHLSKLVDQAASGHDVILARNGKPIARITTLEAAPQKVTFGVLKGKVHIADDFDLQAPLPDDLLGAFYGVDR